MMDMLCEFMRIVRIHCGFRWFVVVVFGYGGSLWHGVLMNPGRNTYVFEVFRFLKILKLLN